MADGGGFLDFGAPEGGGPEGAAGVGRPEGAPAGGRAGWRGQPVAEPAGGRSQRRQGGGARLFRSDRGKGEVVFFYLGI